MIDYLTTEDLVLNKLKSNYKLKIEEACFSTEWIPKHILLDRTRNIHSYFVFATNNENEYEGRYFTNKNQFENQVMELIKTQYSSLDRPLFFVFMDKNDNLLSIEGSLIREFILEKKKSQTIKNFISNEVVSFNEIINKIKKEL
ncbi:hypothetical protein [Flavobacterium solisilvae]|uniref:Uncharacterized protein n=1 Tax=Flavobacterium solisilvae TaxID=1852019 RepID=A0ABX1QV12_9FLAO|nr:hypothetical protein [Flavobacterium solisilvae]NMH24923.1 hypothetical protein [Flavobacterium solisilvae]